MNTPPPGGRIERRAKMRIPGMIALAVVILIAYLPTLEAGYIWDDQTYVVGNTNLVRPDGLRRIWLEPFNMVQYYPLVHTVLWLEYRLWQLRPMGYHLVNVLLHALNAILLWIILERLAVPGAGFVAAVFGLHPLQVESVAWITEIKNLLSGVLYFLSFLAYLRFREARRLGGSARQRASGSARAWVFPYSLSLVLFLLALLAKTTAVTLPVVLLVLLWWKSDALRRDDILPVIPMFLLAAAFGSFTWWLETFHVGTERMVSLPLWDRLLVAGRAAWFYPGKLFWPVDLSFVYPRWKVDLGVWWQHLFPLGAVAVIASLWFRRKRLGKGPLAAVLFYVVTLAPVSGVLNFYFMLYSFVGDHFQYLASIGIVALAVAPAMRWIGGERPPGLQMVLKRGLPALVLAVLAVLTWNRAKIYANEETLWRDTLAKNPSAWMAHINLGLVYKRQGRQDEAAAHFVEALEYNPNAAEAHANLGLLFQEQGHSDRAIEEYRKTIAIKPTLADIQYNLGFLLRLRGEREEASGHFREALTYRPKFAEAHANLGDIFVEQGRFDRAIDEYRTALAINPSMAKVQFTLGGLLAAPGSFPEARKHLAEAVRLDPSDANARALLGVVLENLGDRPGALQQYRRALELNPQIPLAREGIQRLSALSPPN